MKKNIDKKKIAEQTKKILSRVLKIKYAKIGNEISINTETSWDSVSQIEIIFDLEKIFKIKFKESEYSQLTSLKNILQVIEKYTYTK